MPFCDASFFKGSSLSKEVPVFASVSESEALERWTPLTGVVVGCQRGCMCQVGFGSEGCEMKVVWW